MEDHFTAGYTLVTDKNEWTFFLMYVPEVELSEPSQFDPAQTISFKIYQVEFGLDYTF